MRGQNTQAWAVCAVAIGLMLSGCSPSSGNSGGGGGGGDTGSALLRVVHLAPEVPAAGATRLDFDIANEGSFNGFGFARVSDYAALPPGIHTISASKAGTSTQRLARLTTSLDTDGRYTVVAYRDSAESSALGLSIIDESTIDLAVDRARLLVFHGADDSSWSAVNLVDAETDEVYVTGLMFANRSGPVDLLANTHRLGFDVSPPDSMIDAGPFAVNVEEGTAYVFVVVDTNTADASVAAAAYLMGPETIGSISPLPPE